MIGIKSCKTFTSEDVVNYCITAIIMFSAGRKVIQALRDEFRVYECFKVVSFCGCAPMHTYCCLSSMMQIYV